MRQDGLARRTDPAAPGEADYEALCAALMATARGRAFLDEHARRARQADTAVALEALARLEYLLRQNQDGAGTGERLRADLRALMLAVGSARNTFDKFEGALAKRETVMALFDLLEQRIGDLLVDLPEREPKPANENQARPSPPVAAMPVPAEIAQMVAALEQTPPQAAPAPAAQPPAPSASERAQSAQPQLAALAALIAAEPAAAIETVSHIEAEVFSGEAYVPFEYEPPEPTVEPVIEPVAASIAVTPPSPPPAPAPAMDIRPPRPRRDIIAQLMALTPAERIALFS